MKYIFRILNLRTVFIGILCLMTLGCQSTPSFTTLTVEETIRDSDLLNGAIVTVSGYIVLEHEDHNLYATIEDARDKVDIDTKCVSLSITDTLIAEWQKSSGSLVSVTGQVDSGFCGHDKYCPSSCNKIGLKNVSISL